MPSVLWCYHEMRFEMFTEHEVELLKIFGIVYLHTNFFNLNKFFLSICMQHTDKNVPRKWFFGGIFLVLCTAGLLKLLGALPPGLTGGLIAPPRQPATPGNERRSLHIMLSAGYHFHPCPHDKFGPPL